MSDTSFLLRVKRELPRPGALFVCAKGFFISLAVGQPKTHLHFLQSQVKRQQLSAGTSWSSLWELLSFLIEHC